MLTVVPRPIVVRAPSKVNLHLSVGDLRDDGFHELDTVYQALSLHDDVSVVTAPVTSLVVRGDDASSVPTDESNLAWRAAAMVAEAVGRTVGGRTVGGRTVGGRTAGGRDPNVAITIDKGIPVAGGMAGGSADAAAALLAVDALWNLELSRAELMSFAERLGSDVPFALAGGTSVGTGRGEKLLPVLSRSTFHWVLALAKGGLSTPAVYRELDELRAKGSPPRLGDSKDLMLALASGDPHRVAPLLGNDLQAAALSLAPRLRRTLRAGVAAGALAGIVSGSGPTCAFLCTSAESAVAVSAELAGAGVCRTVRVATGPVPGARVLGDGNSGDNKSGQQQRGHH